MTDIIFSDKQWEVIYRKHDAKCVDIQHDLKSLEESGLKVTIGDLKDLIDHGTALYEQAEQLAKSNASIFKLPKARQMEYEKYIEHLNQVINDAKRHLFFVLAINSPNQLSIDAFSKVDGTIQINEKWKTELEESYTIRKTEQREKALELLDNVERAITELNAFVADNPSFGKGITSFDDGRRCLCYLREEGAFVRCDENLKFI